MSKTGKNIIPEGYVIRSSTIKRFDEYLKAYSDPYKVSSRDPEVNSQRFYKDYGQTYWYYLHFINNELKIR